MAGIWTQIFLSVIIMFIPPLSDTTSYSYVLEKVQLMMRQKGFSADLKSTVDFLNWEA